MEENELFEDYINNRLPADERQQLELRLATDAALKERFEFYRTVQADMEHWQSTAEARANLRETLRNQAGATPRTGKVRSIRRYTWAVAAAASVVIILSLWKFSGTGDGSVNNRELYAQYAGAETISGSRGSNADSLADAYNLIYDKQYTQAAAALNKYAGQSNEPALFLAYCQTQAGMHAEAEKNLDAIIASGNILTPRAKWFRALLLLKMNRLEDCKKELTAIAGSGGAYSIKAQQLQQKLQ